MVEDDEGTLLTSGDGWSLNLEYTKGLEREVEDMIKDIMFIGSGKSSMPGRRKLKSPKSNANANLGSNAVPIPEILIDTVNTNSIKSIYRYSKLYTLNTISIHSNLSFPIT
jgi:hypothetical protein